MNTKELYSIFKDSSGVTTDSRSGAPGRIFFALHGDNFDGHHYVEQALNKGCIKAVIDDNDFAVPGKTILVDNVLTSLQQLACYYRQTFNIPVLAITGSNGKTTTKELIREVLSRRFKILATCGNLNNHIGVPLTLLKLESDHEIAVIEMGANHIGEINALCNIAMPTHGLITNIGYAHLEGFGSYEGVKKAKGELFQYLKDTGGTAFINSDRAELVNISQELRLKQLTYGTGEGYFVGGTLLDHGEHLEAELTSRGFAGTLKIKTRLTGTYNFENVLAAAVSGIFFGVPPEEVKYAVENYVPGNNRSQITITPNNKLLMDAYNANPDSMLAAITNFSSLQGENKSVILGDMLELGEYAEEEHIKIVNVIKDLDFKEVMLVGEVFKRIPAPDNFIRFEDTDQLVEWMKINPLTSRFVLLKGSRGIKLEKCTEVL
ncbi:MAG: UDP-N-acetylmuramoyl-tripeptide--D-alanyl-D-alanine ligase [Bacteroidales bacterium]